MSNPDVVVGLYYLVVAIAFVGLPVGIGWLALRLYRQIRG